MAQLTLYLPDDLVERLRAEAAAAHRSLSAHVRARLERPAAPADALDSLFGSCDLGPASDDPPPDEVAPL